MAAIQTGAGAERVGSSGPACVPGLASQRDCKSPVLASTLPVVGLVCLPAQLLFRFLPVTLHFPEGTTSPPPVRVKSTHSTPNFRDRLVTQPWPRRKPPPQALVIGSRMNMV